MSFLNPILLLGLLGASVPIIIHLIHKRRPRKQMFAAIELLLRSIQRVERRWRIKRFLLLAARVSLIALLALAAAGPLFGSRETLSIASSGPKRIGIVIDTSLSMRAQYGKASAFTRAIAQARGLVDAMGPEDQAIIVAAREKPELLLPRPTGSRQELYDVIDRLSPSFGRGEMGEAATAAAQALSSLKEENAPGEDPEGPPAAPAMEVRVIVLSDLAGHAFQTAAELALGSSGKAAQLEIVDVLADIPADKRLNRGIVLLESSNVPGRAPRTIELRSRIQSFAGEKADETRAAEISLWSAGGQLEAASVDVVPGTVVDKVLRHSFDEAGTVAVEVRLEPDVLADDDVRYATADVRRQVRALVVDGAPSGVPKEDEVFYFERALAAGAGDQPPPHVVTADDLPHVDLGSYDVVVLAGVGVFSRSDGARISEFVEHGGGLLISASADLDIELYNAELGRILPRAFRALRVADLEKGGLGAEGVVTLRAPKTDHPVMEIFDAQSMPGLLSSKTRAYLLLEPGGTREVETLVEFEDGQPAIVEGRAGQGKVIVLTTSIDRDLTDLPIRPAFVPLVRRLLLELGNALSKPDPRKTLVGEVRDLHVPKGASRMIVSAPDGKETEWSGAELVPGTDVSFPGTTLPGHYGVRIATAGPLEPFGEEDFVVNVDTRESDLRPLTVDEATSILLGTAEPTHERDAGAIARARALRGLANPEAIAGLLLVFMLIAFLLESALTAQRIGR